MEEEKHLLIIENRIETIVQSLFDNNTEEFTKEVLDLIENLEKSASLHGEDRFNEILRGLLMAYAEKNYLHFVDVLTYELTPVVKKKREEECLRG